MPNQPEFDVPEAISYQGLRHHLQTAPREESCEDSSGAPGANHLDLQKAMANYAEASQGLLRIMHSNNPDLQQGFSANQLMALGALSAHIRMGLQALKASLN
jgi:DNA-binding LacI/PurR family transcriptional regulator